MTVKGSVLDRHVETLFSAYKIAESERPPPQAPPCAFLKEISDINGCQMGSWEFSPASLGLLLMKHHLGDGNVFKAFNSWIVIPQLDTLRHSKAPFFAAVGISRAVRTGTPPVSRGRLPLPPSSEYCLSFFTFKLLIHLLTLGKINTDKRADTASRPQNGPWGKSAIAFNCQLSSEDSINTV